MKDPIDGSQELSQFLPGLLRTFHACFHDLCFSNLSPPTSLKFSSVQFNSVPCQIWSSGGHEGRFSRDPLPVFSARGPCEKVWNGQGCPLFDVVHPAFPLPTTALPTLQGVLKDGFGEAVVACDMPEPCTELHSFQILVTIKQRASFLPLNQTSDEFRHAGSVEQRSFLSLSP